MTGPRRPQLLVIDDEPGFRSLLGWRLRAHGFDVHLARDGQEGLDRLAERPFDLVITDITMPRREGLHVLELVRRDHPGTGVIVITGFATIEMAVSAMRLGAVDFLMKPFHWKEFKASIDRALACRPEQKSSDGLLPDPPSSLLP